MYGECFSLPDLPSPPGQPIVASVTRNSATLSWAPPRKDGGTPITNYIIEAKSSSGYSWNMVNIGYKITNNEYTVTELMDGTTYEFRVIAKNKVGRSEPSPVSEPVVVREPVSGNAPRVIEQLHDVYADVHDSAKLQCRVTGEPEPEITW